ncbi:hypothetical protein B0H19DRAFT_1231947 [Mycena capillaripes]|nr:hypothetical protein B0H19DRAFT_1231947 [Mycena capillaripes]
MVSPKQESRPRDNNARHQPTKRGPNSAPPIFLLLIHHHAPASMASLIQTFPYEVLSQIFIVTETFPKAPYADAVILSHVCHHWREAAVGDSSLWLQIGVCHRDVRHIQVIADLLRRSKTRKISIGMDFGAVQRPANPALFGRLLRVIRAHLSRTCHLFIYAQWQTWQAIVMAFATQTYPSLTLLDVELIPPAMRSGPWVYRVPVNGGPALIAVRTAPQRPVVFRIPHYHPLLNRLRISGISLGNAPLPNLALIRISGKTTPNLVGTDGRLHRWLLDGPKSLYFEDMQVPPMLSYVPQDIEHRQISTITHLILSGLRASPRAVPGVDGQLEHPCIPFFDSLYTPELRCLQIDRWDISSRVWQDFLSWLPEDIRFPCVVDLRITGMHFEGMDYLDVAFFLGSFPHVRHVRLEDCWPGTWESALDILQMDETLCPGLQKIRLSDNLIMLRNDPLPFATAY